MAIPPGTKIGPYEVLEPLGAGGMGEVYRARDSRLRREVALKILPVEYSANADRLSRFELEARSASALNHPNIVVVYEIGTFDSISYISMELVDGKSLRASLNGPLPTRKAVTIASQFVDGLAKAHSAGIVHRDLKPENLMISKDGFVKILDFGLAKLTTPSNKEASGLPTETGAGTVLGTVGYMSPEQASGKTVDFRSDQFSFGTILYEMITGKHPFQRSTAVETMTAIIREDPPQVSSMNVQIPAPLRWILERCLAKDPEERYASTLDLSRDLKSIRDHISEVTSGSESVSAISPSRSRYRYWIPALLLVSFLAGLGAARWLTSSKPTEPMKFTTLTFSGTDSSPAVSPDGKLIAFRSDRDGTPRIWLKQLIGGNEVALTTGPDDYPRFSPDGSAILFTRFDNQSRSLYRIPILGGEERKILDDAHSGDWSPDGKQIAFVRWKGANSSLGVVTVDGADVQEWVRIENKRLEFPRWSPDGSRIAVIGALTQNVLRLDNILIFDVATKNKKWIVSNWTTSAVWSGSDNKILYGISDSPAAYPTNFRLVGRILLQEISSSKIQSLFWSSSIGDILDILGEGKLVLHSASVRENLRQTSLNEKSTSPESLWFTRGNSIDRQPIYSKDGERILFSSTRSGNLDLWELTIKSGTLRRITEDSAEDWDPAYTPDGKHIIWSSGRNGHFEIWMINLDGSGARKITNDEVDAENPTMTSNGNWIVYCSYNPVKAGIWKIHPDGTGAVRIASGVTAWPEISPDGRYVVYVWFKESFLQDPKAYVRILEVSSGKNLSFEIECANGANIGARCRWMPDGRQIAYVDQNEKGAWGIFVQDFLPGKDTSETRRPLAGFDRDRIAETFSISPNSQEIVLSELEILSNLVMVENVPGVSRAK